VWFGVLGVVVVCVCGESWEKSEGVKTEKRSEEASKEVRRSQEGGKVISFFFPKKKKNESKAHSHGTKAVTA